MLPKGLDKILRNIFVWALLAAAVLSCFPLSAAAGSSGDAGTVQESVDTVQDQAGTGQEPEGALSDAAPVLTAQSTNYVCKIGNTPYLTVQAAVAAVPTNGTAVIELLKDAAISSEIAVNSGKTITFAKAAEDAAVYPYEGTAGSIPQLIRSGFGYQMMNINGAAHVSFGNVCLNGNNISTRTSILYVQGGSSVVMNDGSSIINARGYQGSAAYVTGASTFTMQGDSSISGCVSQDSAALDLSGGSVMTITGSSSIHDNSGISHGSGIFVRISGAKSTLNISGNAAVYNNTTTANNSESATIVFHHDAGTLNISDSAQIYGNTNGSSTIYIPYGDTMNMTGGSITGNTALNDSSALSGGVAATGNPTINLSGSPVISGNINNRTANQKDLYLAVNTSLHVTGDLTQNASVGIFCNNHMTAGSQFGSTVSSSASSVAGLYTLFNDNNTGSAATDLYGLSGTGSQVVWGSGTCQIIRNGVLHGIYATLAEACADSVSGDTIEVFKSHDLTGTAALSDKTGITIKTAPTDTPSAPGARTFMPSGNETDTATVTRGSSFTSGDCLYISGSTSSVTVSGVNFDGGSVATNSRCIDVMGGTFNINNSKLSNTENAALFGYAGTHLNVSGCTFSDNTAIIGGAIVSLTDLTVSDSVFENNKSTGTSTGNGGGAIFGAGSVNLQDSSFTNNESVNNGGAVMMYHLYDTNTLTMDNCTVSGGKAQNGSAVYLGTGTNAVFTGTDSITGNTALADHGGAVYVTDSAAGTLTLKGSPTVSGNTALGSDSNVTLPAGGIINADGALTNASVGVTVSPDEHVIFHKFAENYDDTGTAVSTSAASANKQVFTDDRTYKMGIGANAGDAGMDTSFNTYNFFIGTKHLGISKTVTGNMADMKKHFTFGVTIAEETGTGISGSFNCSIAGTDHTITFTDGAVAAIDGNAANTTISLGTGECFLLHNVPYGMTYTVIEAEANTDQYTTTYCTTDLDSNGNPTSVRTSFAAYTGSAAGTIGEAGKQADFVNDKTLVSYPTGVGSGSRGEAMALLLAFAAGILLAAVCFIKKRGIHGSTLLLLLFLALAGALAVPSDAHAEDRISAQMPSVTVSDTGSVPSGTVHTLVLTALDGAPLPDNQSGTSMEITVPANSTAEPGTIYFPAPGIYRYTIQEQTDSSAVYTSDSSQYTVSVYILNDSGTTRADFIVECGGQKLDSVFFCNSWPENNTLNTKLLSGGNVKTGDGSAGFPVTVILVVSLLVIAVILETEIKKFKKRRCRK